MTGGPATGRCHDDDVDQIVEAVLAAVEGQDCSRVKALLHPYLRWSEPGLEIRGRSGVMTRLAAGPTPRPPATHELRDGQIYRWTSA